MLAYSYHFILPSRTVRHIYAGSKCDQNVASNKFWRAKIDKSQNKCVRPEKDNATALGLSTTLRSERHRVGWIKTRRCCEFGRLKSTRCLVGAWHRFGAVALTLSCERRRARVSRSVLSNDNRPSSLLHGRGVRAEVCLAGGRDQDVVIAGSLRACAFFCSSTYVYSSRTTESFPTACFSFLSTGRASGRGEAMEGERGAVTMALNEHPREGAKVLAAGIAAGTTTCCANSLRCVP